MKIDGRCHCGAIAYSAEVEPEKASICHCTDCQRFSGSPFRASVLARIEDFRLLSGSPKIYVKTADSGARRGQAFCSECGAPIYATDAENPENPPPATRRDRSTIRDPAAPADLVFVRAAMGLRHPVVAFVAGAVTTDTERPVAVGGKEPRRQQGKAARISPRGCSNTG